MQRLVTAIVFFAFGWSLLGATSVPLPISGPAGQAAPRVVTDCSDYNAPGGLAAAVAISGTVTFACSGTIVFPDIISIVVAAANSPLTIDGSGQNVVFARASGDLGRLVTFSGSGLTLTLRNLTLRDGVAFQGGAVRLSATSTMTIEGVTFLNNRSNGFFGGALAANTGTVTIRDSRFEGNTTGNGNGGALGFNGTNVTISGSLFISNGITATAPAFGVGGGAISVQGGGTDLAVTNSTFISNTAAITGTTNGGGAIGAPLGSDIIRLNQVTMVGNSGGGDGSNGETISVDSATVRIANSILSGPGPRCKRGLNGNIINDNGNFESGSGSALCGAPPPAVVPSSDLDLGPLADNGGPTATIALLAFSVAKSSGLDVSCALPAVAGVDQRGVRRPSTACSTGAYQFGVAPVLTSISPPAVNAAGPSFSLTISGEHFIAGSIARLNGASLATTFVSTTTLTATVPASAIIQGGSLPLTVRYPGPTDPPSAPLPLTVNKLAQTITFPPIGDRAVDASPFSPAVSASSGLAVTLASTTPLVCIASGTTVTLLSLGGCTLTASQAGDGTYLAADSVSRSFQVLAAGTTPSPTPPPGASPTPTATPGRPAASAIAMPVIYVGARPVG